MKKIFLPFMMLCLLVFAGKARAQEPVNNNGFYISASGWAMWNAAPANYPIPDPGDECVIESVEIYGFVEPVAGEAINTNLTVTADNYSVGLVEWYDNASFDPMAEGATFEDGHSYYMIVTLVADDECVASDNCTYAINDDAALVDANPSHTYFLDGVFTVSTIDFEVTSGQPGDECILNEFYVSLEEPVENGTPSATMASVDPEADYTIGDVEWYESTSFSPMEDGETFQSGHSYYCYFALTPKGDCVIDDTYTIYVNDEANTEYDFADENVLYVYSASYTVESGQPQDCVISEFYVSLDEPVENEDPSTATASVDPDADYTISNVYWYESTELDPMEDGETFQSGHEYYCTFSLTPKGDCVIDDTYTIYVNDEANTEYDFADENVLYVYSASYAPEGQPQTCTIETVGLTGVVEPVFGATVSYDGIAAGSDDYEITSLGWYGLTSGDPLEEGATFGEGTYYLYAQLEPNDGCSFDDESVTYFINTTANFADAEYCGYNESIGFYLNSVLFELTDPAGPGDECVIETVNILGFEEPVFGEEISYDGLSLEDDNCTLAAQWVDGNWDPVTTTTFGAGSYFLYFEVKANTGCEYASSVGLAINGESNLVFRSGFMNDSTIYIYTNGYVVVDPTVDCSGFETSFEYGFCDWTTLDADGDGFTWELGGASTSAHNGEFSVYSESYDPSEGELYPDNYLISPKTLITAEKPVVGFWACAQDASWPAEVFSLGVSTTTADAGEFTMLGTWTMTAKKTANTKGVTRGNTKAAGNWYYYSVDLSDYIDSEVYVCIRHHDCSDNFFLNVDDIAFTEPVEPATSLFNDFENGFDGWTFTSMNTENGIGGTGTQPAGIVTAAAHDGSYGLKFSSYNQASDYNQYLISPELAGEEVTMSFYYAVGSSNSSGESFKVGYSTTDNSISSFIFGDEITITSTSWTQSEDFVFPEGTKYVAINYCSNYQYYMYVDEISVGNDNGKKVIANYASRLNKHVIAANSREDHLAYIIKVSADKANNSVKVSNGTQKMVAENARKAIAMNSTKMKVAENARKAVAAKSSIDKKSVAAKHSFRSVAEKQGLKHSFNKVNAWGVKAKDNAYAWDFEDDYYADALIDWTTIDADGDGYDWTLFGETLDASVNMSAYSGYGMVFSESYNSGALLPDNYLVSPQININDETRTFKFWAAAQDASYPAEHFGVAISTDGNTDAADFTTIQEWTMTAKSDAKAQMSRTKANGRGNNRAEGEWYEFSVDLSDYMGQDVYVAIRHFGCTDKYILKVDDISFDGEVLDPFVGYNLYLDGTLVNDEYITDLEYYMQEAETFADGSDHLVLAEAVYKSGNTLSIEQEWTYVSGEHFTPAPEGLTATIDGYTANLSWETPSAGIVPSTFSHDFADGQGNFTVLDANNDTYTWTFSYGTAYISFASPNDDYLIFPQLTLGEGSVLSVATSCYSTDYPETFEIVVSTSGTAADDFTVIATETVSSTSDVTYDFDLSNYNGQTVYLAIHNISDDQWYQFVSSVNVTNVMMEADHIGAVVYRNDEIIAKLQNGETSYYDEFNGADTPEYCIRIIQNGPKEDGTFYALAEKQCAEVVYVCQVPENVNVTVEGTNATVAWEGDAAEYVLKYKPYTGTATVTLTAGNVFSDNTGYQMLLDADANAFGTIIPETGPLTSSGDASAATYAEFEYKIPENADGALTTSNIVMNNSITIEIPAGVYDWCITNPSPDDRMWIAGSNGNIGGRQDDYEFEADKIYEFVPDLFGNNDGVDVTISEIDDEEEWTVIDGITENNYTIEGLTEGTQYIVKVQAICSDGEASKWTNGEVFYIDIDGMNDYANGEIKVYPNPTKANVTIEAEGMSRVIVMNALGQVVYEANVTDNTVINMGQFGSGVYMVNVTTSNGVTVKRVTVAK